MSVLDFKDLDSILRIVVNLYKEIWNDSTKSKENAFKTEQYLYQLLVVSRNDTRALTNLGAIYSLHGKHEKALIELRKSEKLNTKDANLYSNIAIAKMNIESEKITFNYF